MTSNLADTAVKVARHERILQSGGLSVQTDAGQSTHAADISTEAAAVANQDNVSSLHLAALKHDPNDPSSLVGFVGKISANDVNQTVDAHGRTALHYAAIAGNEVGCSILMEELGANVNVTDDQQNTPLHYAARHFHYPVSIDPFIDQEDLQISAKNAAGETPLYIAIVSENAENVRILLQKGANLLSLLQEKQLDAKLIGYISATNGNLRDLIDDMLEETGGEKPNGLLKFGTDLKHVYGDQDLLCHSDDSISVQHDIATLPAAEQERLRVWTLLNTGGIEIGDCGLGKTLKNWRLLEDDEKMSSSLTWIGFGTLDQKDGQKSFDVAVKMSFAPKVFAVDNSLEVERIIYRDVINQLVLNRNTPHVLLYYGTINCDNFGQFTSDQVDGDNGIVGNLAKLAQANTDVDEHFDLNHMRALVLERSSGETLFTFLNMNRRRTNNDVAAVLFQVFYTLAAFRDIGLQHNDLHTRNIFVQEYDDPQTHTYLVGEQHYLVTSKYQARVFDYDRAHKQTTSINKCHISNTYLNTMCLSRKTCQNSQDSRLEIYRLIRFMYDFLPPGLAGLGSFLEWCVPKRVLQLEFEGENRILMARGALCHCEDKSCETCVMETDPRIKMPREILQHKTFEQFKVTGDQADTRFMWSLPAEQSLRSQSGAKPDGWMAWAKSFFRVGADN